MRRHAFVAVSFFVAGLVLAADAPKPSPKPAAKPAAKPTTTIGGRVAGPDGKPLAGAVVRVLAKAEDTTPRFRRVASTVPPTIGRTNEDGTFSIAGLAGSKFRVRVEAPSLAPFQADDVPAGATLRVNLKPGVARTGRVLDMASREPIAGATVIAVERGAQEFGEEASPKTTSGEDGRFTFPHLPPTELGVEAWSPKHARATLSNFAARQAKEGETDAEPTLFLRPGGRIAGRVVGADGKPVEGVSVSPESTEGGVFARFSAEGPRPARTDASGQFDFAGIPAGRRYKLVARKDGFSDATSEPIAVERGEERTDLELKLEAAAALAFKMVDADGNPVTSVTVAVAPPSAAARPGRQRRGPSIFGAEVPEERIESLGEGRFRATGLDVGTFDVTIAPEDGNDVEKEGIRLKAGETFDLGTLRSAPGKRIEGRVLDRNGEPVAGAQLRAFWLDGSAPKGRTAKSKADGRYRLGGLGDAPVQQISVSAKGYAEAQKTGVAPGDTAADFTLEKTASVVGKVVNGDGTIPPSFNVEAKPEAKAGESPFGMRMRFLRDQEVFTDPAGNFRLDDVSPGTVTVEARAIGRAPGRKSGVKVAAEEVVDVGTLTLPEGRTVRGLVLDAKDDTPLAGAAVSAIVAQTGMRVRIPGMNDAAGSAVSGTDGGFEIRGLEPRSYGVAVQHPDFSPNETTVEVPSEQDPAGITVRLSRGGTLTGVVRDAAKAPVPGANIMVVKGMFGGDMQSASTGPDGRYTIEKLAPGGYSAIRQPDDGRVILGMGMKQVQIREGEVATLDFDDAAKHQLSGRILRAGKPVGGVNVFFMQGEGGMSGVLKTTAADADGRYTIGLDEPGTYTVSVSGAMMFGGSQTTIVVPDGPAATIDINLRAGAITGRVIDPDGKPLSGAFLIARGEGSAGSGGAGSAQSGADGAFVIEGIDDGTYRVTANAQGYATAEAFPVTVSPEEATTPIELRLEKGRSLRGRVVDPRGNPVEGAFVYFAPSGVVQTTSIPSSTDVNGGFVLAVPGSGSFDVAASASGLAPAIARGIAPPVEDDGRPIVTLPLTPGGRLRVQVLLKEGGPAAGSTVFARAAPPFLGSDTLAFMNRPQPAGSDGASVLTALAPGGYRLTAVLGKRTVEGSAVVSEGGETAVQLLLP